MLQCVVVVLVSTSFSLRGANSDSGEALAPGPGHVEYCVVGAGPGGLQAAAMLREAGRDVVVFDKSDRAGSFFARFPIHRRLISINKRHFAQHHHDDAEFQLRHDWNSLISLRGGAPPGLKFTNYSDEYYPHADTLVNYLGDFAARMLRGRVSFETEVMRIDKGGRMTEREKELLRDSGAGGASGSGGDKEEKKKKKKVNGEADKFSVLTNKGEWMCDRVIVATGLSRPSPMPRRLQHPDIIGYENLPENSSEVSR